ncbi:MAG: hypothetical protein AYP45_12000 [Candidatus Brocadia carolinensis]|uniref:Cytochrome c-552/DMSO reductase-like haem-binding domain-containing protein n=1 Tax=Candidatus Brocadia carolinensis TaxID=1004156 RepID=A0A1V4ASD4_9BACT|nr:MAG: hypothetical protein AYP45_12000 [Candidatus Brocadia caroliniensis]
MPVHDISGSSRAITAGYISGPITLDPLDPAWTQTPETVVTLSRRIHETGAKMVAAGNENRRIKVKVVHNGTDIFFSHQWDESTPNVMVNDYSLFADALAMEIPLITETSSIWMGAMDKPVNIIYWRADLASPENIVGGGIGTTQISSDEKSQNIRHYQNWSNGVWNVIITRPMVAASQNQVSFVRGVTYRLALANWKGGNDAERGGNKIISDWQYLSIK